MTENGKYIKSAFDENDLLVFYPEDSLKYNKILENIVQSKILIHSPKNAYWKNKGISIQDSDGFGIIISSEKTGVNH